MAEDRSYTGGIKAFGAARRGLIKRQMKTQSILGGLDFIGDIAGVVSSVTGFIGSQKKRADTAWGEYEKGYEALGGTDPITRSKFGEKGWLKSAFKGPEGEVSIGEGKARKTYDIGNVRKAGAFLDTDAATALFSREGGDEIRASYLERTAPGRWAPESFTKPAQDPYQVADELQRKKKAIGAGTYRGPGGQIVDPNPFADLEQSYGNNLYGPTQRNLPESIGYGQPEYLESIWENQVPWSQQYQDIKKKNLMKEGVQQNPYQPGSPWEPDVGGSSIWDVKKMNNDYWDK